MIETYKTGMMALPPKEQGRGGYNKGFDKYKFGEMPAPASGLCAYFIVPYGDKTVQTISVRMSTLARAHGKRLGRNFTTRRLPDGVYVFRVA